MKNLLLFFTFIICIIPFSCFYVSAENTGIIQADTITAKPDDIVDIGISINNNPGIIAICLEVSYDNKCLELSGVDNCELFESSTFTPSGDLKLIPFRLMWMNAITKSDYTDNGKLAILHFKVLDTAINGLSEIKIDVANNDTFNVNMEDVHFESLNGGVNIEGAIDKTDGSDISDSESENMTTKIISSENKKITNDNDDKKINNKKETEYVLPIDKICQKVSEDYKSKTGETPVDTEVVTNVDGTLSIILKNEKGSIIDTYSIDPKTGKGTDSKGNELNISEKKKFPVTNVVIIIMGIMAAFSLIIYKFFMIRKNKKM